MSSTVTAVTERMKKPYLGSWMHKITGVRYLNATSQTGPSRRRLAWNEMCSRGVQFVQTKQQATQSNCDRSTQMWRPDCHVPNTADKFMTAQSYQSFDELRLKYDFHARIIQRCYRAYRIRKRVKECAVMYRKMVENCEKHEEERIMLSRQRCLREIASVMYPRKRSDFDMLFHLINNWSRMEYNRLKVQLFECSQRATSYCVILEKTVQLLNDVNKQRRFVAEATDEKKRLHVLRTNCKSVQWIGYKAKPIEMITLRVQLAREYGEWYKALDNESVTIGERIGILSALKIYFNEMHNCQTASDLQYLLDQEITFSRRGIKGVKLKYLRKRVKSTVNRFLIENYCSGIIHYCEIYWDNDH